MIELTNLILSALAVFVAVVLRFVVPWVRANTTAKQREELLEWINIAVMAAEQLHWKDAGAVRKQYVVDFLKENGFDVDSAEVDAAIEAAVLSIHKELEAA